MARLRSAMALGSGQRCEFEHHLSKIPKVEQSGGLGDHSDDASRNLGVSGHHSIDSATVHDDVAIERTSKFALAQLIAMTDRTSNSAFLAALAVPFNLRTALADYGIQFTFPRATPMALPPPR